MGRMGIFLTRRQIALVRRLLITNPIPVNSEMQDLRREIDNAHAFAEKDKANGWGGNYEWNEELETRKNG